jgi:hypothetical protein
MRGVLEMGVSAVSTSYDSWIHSQKRNNTIKHVALLYFQEIQWHIIMDENFQQKI